MSLRLSSNAATETAGTYTFDFSLSPCLTETNLLSSLQATAFLSSQPLPLRCKWYRVKDEKTLVLIPEITSR